MILIKRAVSLLLALTVLSMLLLGFCSCDRGADSVTLTVTVAGDSSDALIEAMRARFPNIRFEVTKYTGKSVGAYLSTLISGGSAGDIIYTDRLVKSSELTNEMLDISGYPFMGNLSDIALRILDTDGRIYQVPSPLDIRCMVYNKTLFAENGWDAPRSHAELLSLVERIRTETPDITPIALALGSDEAPFATVASLSQCGFLSTPAGNEWIKAFLSGDASAKDGFSGGLDMIASLIDADAFDAEKYLFANDCTSAMLSRGAAIELRMMNTSKFIEAMSSSECTDEFGFLPFYGLDERESLVGYRASSAWGINTRLGERGNERKLEGALEVMEWLTGYEAQCLLGDMDRCIPSIEDERAQYMDPHLRELWSKATDGYHGDGLYSGFGHIMSSCSGVIRDAMLDGSSAGMKESFIDIADGINSQRLNKKRSE